MTDKPKPETQPKNDEPKKPAPIRLGRPIKLELPESARPEYEAALRGLRGVVTKPQFDTALREAIEGIADEAVTALRAALANLSPKAVAQKAMEDEVKRRQESLRAGS